MTKPSPFEVFLSGPAGQIILDLVVKKDPLARPGFQDDLIEPSLSGVVTLLDDLLQRNAPHLSPDEWAWLSEAVATGTYLPPYRIPPTVADARRLLVHCLEDIDGPAGGVNTFELSKKISHWPDLAVCSAAYLVQRFLAAHSKGQDFSFPVIPFKG